MNYKRLLIVAAVSVLLLSTSTYSQDALTIDQSIEIALENSP